MDHSVTKWKQQRQIRGYCQRLDEVRELAQYLGDKGELG